MLLMLTPSRAILGRSRDGLYEPVLADSEREAVADLLQYLENVWCLAPTHFDFMTLTESVQRAETDFFSGEPLRALSTLVYSDNVDLQRSASLTFAEITERGRLLEVIALAVLPFTDCFCVADVREVDRDTLEPILFLLQSPDIEVQRAASAALGNLAVNSKSVVLDHCWPIS
jgi:vacuolar protein 8